MAQVNCFASYSGVVRPVAFEWGYEALKIAAVITEWRAPDKKHFLVRTTDDRVFELIYGEATNEWFIKQR